jgi:hypothetical protein
MTSLATSGPTCPSSASEFCARSTSNGRRGIEAAPALTPLQRDASGNDFGTPRKYFECSLKCSMGVGQDLEPAISRRRTPPVGRPGRRGGLCDEERLRVYGEVHLAVPSQILPLYNLPRSLDAVGLHRYAETSSAAYCLDRDPQHFALSLRRPVVLGSVRGDNHRPEGSRELGKGAQRVSRPATSKGRPILDVCVSPICSCSVITVTSVFLLRVAVHRPHAGVGGSPGRTGARWSRGKRWSVVHRSL